MGPFSVFKGGPVGSRRRGGAGSFALVESEGPVLGLIQAVFVVGGVSLGDPSLSPPSNGPPHRSPISLLFYLPLSKTIDKLGSGNSTCLG